MAATSAAVTAGTRCARSRASNEHRARTSASEQRAMSSAKVEAKVAIFACTAASWAQLPVPVVRSPFVAQFATASTNPLENSRKSPARRLAQM